MQRRKLGLTEYYSMFCHDHAGGSTLLSGMISFSGPLTPDLAAQALGMMQRRHAVLRSNIADSSAQADYLTLDDAPPILPFTVLPREGDDHWKAVVESSSMTPFSARDRYLWRVVFLQAAISPEDPGEVIVTFHHSISDGISVGSFFSQFVHNCVSLYNGIRLEQSEYPLLPPVEELLVKKISKPGFLLGLVKSTVRYLWYYRHLNRFEQYVPIEERRHRNIYRVIHDIDAIELVESCRENNVTLTGLLSAALTKAVYHSAETGSNKALQFHVTPVNMRERCHPPVDRTQIGCFVDMIETTIKFDRNTSIWELARTFRKQLMKAIGQGAHMPINYSKPFVSGVVASMEKGMFKSVFPYGIGVTNIGKVDLKASLPPFSIEYFSFCTGRQWGDWMILLHAATIGNTLYLCFAFAEPLAGSEKMNQIADLAVDYVLRPALAGQ